MKNLFSMFLILFLVNIAGAQCGPDPMQRIPNQQFNQPVAQTQAAQQQRQIQQIQVQANFQEAMAKIQTAMRISQIQNSGSPQMQAQTQKSFQDQIQMLQQTYQQQLQALQRQ
jgi:hypothetical protein